ncbi:MAG: hypothetical protein HWN67_00915 [Candidatus Helarchaeota archaeon]|nr:hypothetical protein [Candidatus Helarchaeota archaeon]
MNNSSDFSLDKKRFLIQILIAAIISVLLQIFIVPLIIDPLTRRFPNIFERRVTILITTLSFWFFSFSVSFFFYPENEIINSYLLCSFIPLVIIIFLEFIELFFFDILHMLPIIVVIYIVWKLPDTINLKFTAIASPILVIWFLTVRLLGINYPDFELSFLGISYLIIWGVSNIIIAYIITKRRD